MNQLLILTASLQNRNPTGLQKSFPSKAVALPLNAISSDFQFFYVKLADCTSNETKPMKPMCKK